MRQESASPDEKEVKTEEDEKKKKGTKRKLTAEEAPASDEDHYEVKKEEKVPKKDYSRVNGTSSYSRIGKKEGSSGNSRKAVMVNGDEEEEEEETRRRKQKAVVTRLGENGRVQDPTTPNAGAVLYGGGHSAFNSDIVCQHGNLSPLESRRRLVSERVWRKLRQYFPGTREFPRHTQTCRQCWAQQNEVSWLLKSSDLSFPLLVGRGTT